MTALLAALVAIGWTQIGQDPTGLAQDLAEITNERSVIWTSAFASAADSPLLGSGLEQFSAWAHWDSDPGVSLQKVATYDPHNILLYWLLGGGVIGLSLALGAVALVIERMIAVMKHRPSMAMMVLSAGLIAWGITLMTAWISPLAALFAVVLFAALVGADDHARAGEKPSGLLGIGTTLTAFVAAIFVLAVWWTPLQTEFAWAGEVSGGITDPTRAAEIAIESDGPFLASVAIEALLDEAQVYPELIESNFAKVSEMEPIIEADAEWNVDAAYVGFSSAVARHVALGEDTWENASRHIDKGKKADPASGLWDYVAAEYALRFGMSDAAAEYAEAALAYPLPSEVRGYLTEIADKTIEIP